MHKQWQWLMLNTNRQRRENDDETGTTHTTIYGKCHACSRCVCAYEANFVLSFSFNIRDMAGVCCCHRKSFSVYNEWECNFWRQITLKIETKTLRGAEAKRQVKRKAYARTHAHTRAIARVVSMLPRFTHWHGLGMDANAWGRMMMMEASKRETRRTTSQLEILLNLPWCRG